MDPAAVELALSALFVQGSSSRDSTLRAAASRVTDWEGLGERLESHGVLPLVHRNLGRAGATLPPAIEKAYAERVAGLLEDAQRFRLTQETVLTALSEVGVVPTLLKGASLALDLYPEDVVRGMGDLDLLVEPALVRRAIDACEGAGLVMGPSSFPTWWYRLAHFHLKLCPSSTLLREVEVHWALHHPSLLLTVTPQALHRRRLTVLEGRACTLDVADRLLHLITHLASHAYGARSASRADLHRVLTDPAHPLRLKWLVDILGELERVHATIAPEDFRERVREWGAEDDVGWVLAWIMNALDPISEAVAWAAAVVGAEHHSSRTESTPAHAAPLASFDFRAGALRRFPRWVWPPAAYFERRDGFVGALRRCRHAVGVLGRSLLSGAAVVPACLGRLLLRARRQRAERAARMPERILDHAAALRSLGRRRPAA